MRRNFKAVFYMRGNYVNKEGKSAIMLRITLDGERVTIGTTGMTITPSLWDMKQQRLKGKSTEAMQTNHQIDCIRAELTDISNRLELEGRLTLENVKNAYLRKDKPMLTIRELLDLYMKNVTQQVGSTLGTASYTKYRLAKERFLSMLSERYNRGDMPLAEITPAIIQDYYLYLTSVIGQCNNTATKALKTLRTVFLYAIKMGAITKDPYIGLKFHMNSVDRGFLTEEEISTIMNKKFTIRRLDLVRDIFLFSCFTGLAYIDVAGLKPENIVTLNGTEWLIARRQKTNTPVNVVLLQVAKDIMKKYEHDVRRKDLIFPIISNQKLNSYLKEIADVCGIKKNISFHVARHTFATLTLSKGVPIESVSRMLGHTNIKTTQIYARITNKKIEQDMSDFAKKMGELNEISTAMRK